MSDISYPVIGAARVVPLGVDVEAVNPLLGYGEIWTDAASGVSKIGPGHWNDLAPLSPEGFGAALSATFVKGAVSATEPEDPEVGQVWIEPGKQAHSIVTAALGLGHILAWDTFDRPDTSGNDLGTADSGHVWARTSGSSWRITSGKAHQGVSLAQVSTWVDVGVADHQVEATLVFSNGEGLVVRHNGETANADARYVLARLASNSIALFKWDGSATQLATASATFTAGQSYRVRLSAKGTALEVFVNGKSVLTHTLTGDDATTLASGTRVGLRANSDTTGRFDDFVVRPS